MMNKSELYESGMKALKLRWSKFAQISNLRRLRFLFSEKKLQLWLAFEAYDAKCKFLAVLLESSLLT